MRTISFLFAFVILGACGGAPDGHDDLSTDASSSTDAKLSIDAPSSASTVTPYFPLSVGRHWEYRTSRLDGTVGTECGADGVTHAFDVVSTHVDGGMDVFVRTESHACYQFTAVLPYRIDNGNVEVNSDTVNWYLMFQFPPQADHPWAAGAPSGAHYVWDQQLATWTVASGTYSDCWRRAAVETDGWEIYCRDVGMVESHWGGFTNSRYELIATSP